MLEYTPCGVMHHDLADQRGGPGLDSIRVGSRLYRRFWAGPELIDIDHDL